MVAYLIYIQLRFLVSMAFYKNMLKNSICNARNLIKTRYAILIILKPFLYVHKNIAIINTGYDVVLHDKYANTYNWWFYIIMPYNISLYIVLIH